MTLAGSSEMYDELDASQLVAAVRHKPDGERLPALRAGRVEMFADTEGAELLSRKVPADHWLTAEVSEGIVHYFYWQGQWYEIGAEYLATVESRIAELLARPASVTLPPWTKSGGGSEKHDEDWYNKEIAKQDGYVLLDKNTVRTRRLRGGGLEIADALGPSGQFVCVKKADSTAPLNHLFAQGRVAIETLRYDHEAREKFLVKLQAARPGPSPGHVIQHAGPGFRHHAQGRDTGNGQLPVRLRQDLAAPHSDDGGGHGRAPGDRIDLQDITVWIGERDGGDQRPGRCL